jgi:hypothetical protein
MRAFSPAPQSLALLAGIERFIATKDPRALVPAGATPADPEQRAYHLHLLDLMPLVTEAVTVIQALIPYTTVIPVVATEAPSVG